MGRRADVVVIGGGVTGSAAAYYLARAGVDVRLILPGQSDSPAAFHAGRSHYEELLEGGVKIYERRGSPLHAKAAVVDGVWSCIGSSNLDWRSALDNDEVNAVVIGREFAGRMEAAYTRDIAASDAITLESWRRHPLRSRFKEWAARLLGDARTVAPELGQQLAALAASDPSVASLRGECKRARLLDGQR